MHGTESRDKAASRGIRKVRPRVPPRPDVTDDALGAGMGDGDTPLTWALIMVAAGAAAAAGLLSVGTDRIAGALLPIIALVGIGLILIAVWDFEVFVAIALVGRASLDAFKLGTGAGGPAIDVTSAFALVFAAVGALWLVLQPRWEERRERSPLAAPLWLLIGAGALGTVAAPDMARSGSELTRLVALAIFLAVLYRFVLDARRRTLVLGALFASAVVPLVVGFTQIAASQGVIRSGFVRVTGTFQHPNPYSIYLALVLIFGIALLRYLKTAVALPAAVLILAIAVALVFTYTRTAWIAALVGLVVVGLLDNRLLLAGLILGVVAVLILVPSILDRFDDLDQTTTASGQTGNSLAWRVDTWSATLGEIGNPISGAGLRSADTLTEDGKLPHNDLIRMYAELGVLGLIAYLWLLQRLFAIARTGVKSANGGLARGIAVGFAGALAAFLVISFVSNVMSQLVLWWYFGTMAVLAAAVPAWETKRTQVAA